MVPGPSRTVGFVETMDCLGVRELPQGPEWTYEIKLDGYRIEAVRNAKATTLYSRRRTVLSEKFAHIAAALSHLPAGTIIDGELVAFGADHRADFNLLQNFRSAQARIHYYAFDLLYLKGRSLLGETLRVRRELLAEVLRPSDQIALCAVDSQREHILKFVKAHHLEGVVAKRADSLYEPGLRTGLWQKHRLNHGQEFVIGGYTPGTHGFDALIIGVYVGKQLHFAARVRAGFVPASRREVFAHVKELKVAKCPFANLPEEADGRWGQGLTAEKMQSCIWVKPQVVVQVEFAQWTEANKLRHARYVRIRSDKDPTKVVREEP